MTKDEEKIHKIKRNEQKNKRRTEKKRERLQEMIEENRAASPAAPLPVSLLPSSDFITSPATVEEKKIVNLINSQSKNDFVIHKINSSASLPIHNPPPSLQTKPNIIPTLQKAKSTTQSRKSAQQKKAQIYGNKKKVNDEEL